MTADSRGKASSYVCVECGAKFPCFYGKCPSCAQWGTLQQEEREPSRPRRTGVGTPVIACDKTGEPKRLPSGIGEFDRVLGGGFVEGSALVLVGEPGIGKSTLLSQVCLSLSRPDKRVLYYSGEESASQVSGRMRRLSVDARDICGIDLISDATVEELVEQLDGYSLLAVDSIQMCESAACESRKGSPSQVKACAEVLTEGARRAGVPCVIVGHINKEGDIAGPRFLEHMVDAVLFFDSDPAGGYRLLKASKNRHGNADETGVFEMTEQGLVPVDDPSRTFWEKRGDMPSGIAFAMALAGSRPVCVEAQALAVPTGYPYPRRTASGMDVRRVQMLLAVMEKHAGTSSSSSDVYVNLASGFAGRDTGADLGVTAALLSALLGLPAPSDTCFAGEVGLAGEIRPAPRMSLRISEAVKLDFKRIIVSEKLARNSAPGVIGLRSVSELIDILKG